MPNLRDASTEELVEELRSRPPIKGICYVEPFQQARIKVYRIYSEQAEQEISEVKYDGPGMLIFI